MITTQNEIKTATNVTLKKSGTLTSPRSQLSHTDKKRTLSNVSNTFSKSSRFEKKKTMRKAVPPSEEEKIYQIKCDIIEIEQLVEMADTLKKRELLLDRGIVLSKYLNDLMGEYNLTVNDVKKLNCSHIMSGYKNNNVFIENKEDNFNPETLTLKFWTDKKIDRYEKTESRKIFPSEFWYKNKGHTFVGELSKCFGIADKKKFMENYEFLFNQKELY